MGPGVIWNTVTGKRGAVMARNETRMPQVFSLGKCHIQDIRVVLISPTGSVDEDDHFEGFVRFVATPYVLSVMAHCLWTDDSI